MYSRHRPRTLVPFRAMAQRSEVAEGTDERLCEVAAQLDSYGWAAELLDGRWHLVWVSEELMAMYGESDPEQLAIGDHIYVSRTKALERGLITEESAEQWTRTNGPFVLDAVDGASDEVAPALDNRWARLLEELEPRPAPAAWTSTVDFSRADTFRMPSSVRSSCTTSWFPAGTFASPSIRNRPTRWFRRTSGLSPW